MRGGWGMGFRKMVKYVKFRENYILFLTFTVIIITLDLKIKQELVVSLKSFQIEIRMCDYEEHSMPCVCLCIKLYC